jgi:hypothetical protein
MEKKTYWKVEVNTFDDGTVKAAVIGSKESDAPPAGQSRKRPGMLAEIRWFAAKEEAEKFAEAARRKGADKK